MLRSRQAGFTLIEILIGAGLAAIVMVAGFQVLSWYNREMIDSGAKQRRNVDAANLRTHLKRYVSPGNMRHFAFSGKAPPADQTLAQFLLPLPDTCADLTTCLGSTAVIYPSYEKAQSTGLNVLCALSGREWLIDSLDQSYGATSFNAGTFRITPAGATTTEELRTGDDNPYGLLNVPAVTIWLSSGPATNVTVANDGGTWTFDAPANRPLPADCVRQLPANRSGLVKMPVRPADLRQFTGGGAAYGDAELVGAMGAFPMRIVPLRVRSVGLSRGIGPKGEDGVVVRECAFRSDGGAALRCEGNNILQLTPATAVSFDESFESALADTGAAEFYEISTAGAALTGRCVRENCVVLPVEDKANIPVRRGGTEPPNRLDGRGFSFLKQESLRSMRFRVRGGATDEEVIDVPVH